MPPIPKNAQLITTSVVFASALLAISIAITRQSVAAEAGCEAVDPAWSPDGDWILFASNCEGNLELYRIRPNGSELVRLTRTAGAEHTPRWSPDGRRIAYAWNDENPGTEIRVMSTVGAEHRTVVAGGRTHWNPTWSADGRRLAYESHRDGNADIYIVGIESGTELRLTRSAAREVAPAWSPDGSTVAFQSNTEGRYGIYVVDPRPASTPTPLVLVDGQAVAPAWSPSGDRLVFACVFPDETDTELCLWTSAGTGIARLTQNDRRDFAPTFAPDGERIVFMASRPEGGWELRTLSLRDSSETVLPLPGIGDAVAPGGVAPPPERTSEPAWSRDGRRVAFRGGEYPDTDIWIADADGSNAVRITRSDAPDEFPAWSPDGRRLAFSSNRDGQWKLWVMSADGNDARPLLATSTRENDPSRAAWSPDGEWIAVRVTTADDEGDIVLVRPDGTGLTRLTDAPGRDDDPAWSPDGRELAFSSVRDGNREIYIMMKDGSAQTRVTDHPERDVSPSWFPSGRRLAFVSRRRGGINWEIFTIARDGSSESNISNNEHWDFYPAVSPDGRRVLFATIREGGMSGSAELWIMNSEGGGQRPFLR